MKRNPFDNLPKINKEDAINILKKATAKVKFSADYYKAVFHLANFPCEESENVLLDFIKLDFEQLEPRLDTCLLRFSSSSSPDRSTPSFSQRILEINASPFGKS